MQITQEYATPRRTLNLQNLRGQMVSMSPDDRDDGRMAQPLSSCLPQGADAAQVAEASAAIWNDINRALNPVIGPMGVAALYHRSLTRTIAGHAWLRSARRDAMAELDLPALQNALAKQPAADAAAASAALLKDFRDLLASLVGAALTERLLGAVWAHTAGRPPAQDKI